MPADVKYEAVYDTTIFVRDSIKAVVSTLLEAIALVVLVVITVPADLACVDHSVDRGAGVGGGTARCTCWVSRSTR